MCVQKKIWRLVGVEASLCLCGVRGRTKEELLRQRPRRTGDWRTVRFYFPWVIATVTVGGPQETVNSSYSTSKMIIIVVGLQITSSLGTHFLIGVLIVTVRSRIGCFGKVTLFALIVSTTVYWLLYK